MLTRHTNLLLWFAFLGGAAAWFVQFCIVYGLSEINCNSPALSTVWLGLPTWQWLSLLVTVVLGGVAVWSGLVGRGQTRTEEGATREVEDRRRFMGGGGALLSLIFVLAIAYTLVTLLLVPPCV